MPELDDLYVRTKALWESDPEQLERDQPLLARAFAEKPVDQTPAMKVYDRHIVKLEEELRRANRERDDARMLGEERARRLTTDMHAAERQASLLADDVADAERRIKEIKEDQKLATLGWKKG